MLELPLHTSRNLYRGECGEIFEPGRHRSLATEILWRDEIFVPERAVGLADVREVANARIVMWVVMVVADRSDEVILRSERDHFIEDVVAKDHIAVKVEHVFRRTVFDDVFPEQCSTDMTVLVCRKYV